MYTMYIIFGMEENPMIQSLIAILDLGSTENARIAREIRALGVYSEIFAHDITPEALKAIARLALERKSGARGLRAIIEGCMTDTMFDLPSIEGVSKCIITEDAVLGKEKPHLVRALPELPQLEEPAAQIEGA